MWRADGRMNSENRSIWLSSCAQFSRYFYLCEERSGPESGEFRFVIERKFDERVCSTQFEFGADVSAMIFNCAGADAEQRGDLFARFVFGQQRQDAAFGRG